MNAGKLGSIGLRAAGVFLVATVVLGVLYPAVVGLVGQALFPWQAQGSLIEVDGVTYGSTQVGQQYSDATHLWGRPTEAMVVPSAAENGEAVLWYGTENLSPASQEFADRVNQRVDKIRAAHPERGDAPIPSELVTVSGSGFDPHISPAAAEYQVERIAAATGKSPQEVRSIIRQCTDAPFLGVFGQERVNVLEVNLMLDGILDEPL